MDIMERIDMLKGCDFSTREDHEDLCKIVGIFQDEYGIPITEERAGIMITHMAAAFRRNRTGETVEAMARDVFAQAEQSSRFSQASGIMDRITQAVKNPIPDAEREFFLLHICALLERRGD